MPNARSLDGAAEALGVKPHIILYAHRAGAPEPEMPRIGGRRVYLDADIARLHQWLKDRGRKVADLDENFYITATEA